MQKSKVYMACPLLTKVVLNEHNTRLNKTSPRAHMELELDVLGIPGKLVKYVVHLCKRKIEKNYFSSHKLPKLQLTSFWTQGILGVNDMNLRVIL
jgi:hypothetical protein